MKIIVKNMELPPEWVLKESLNHPGRCYYYNKVTNETTWIRPIPYPGNKPNRANEWPPIIYVAQIYIKHGPMDESKEKIKRIFRQIVFENKSFEEMVQQESEQCPDIQTDPNGDVGWIESTDPRFTKEYIKAAWDLRIGEMSTYINTEHGYFIILRRG